jgi:hypothetical protein
LLQLHLHDGEHFAEGVHHVEWLAVDREDVLPDLGNVKEVSCLKEHHVCGDFYHIKDISLLWCAALLQEVTPSDHSLQRHRHLVRDAGAHVVEGLNLVALSDQLEGIGAVFHNEQVAFLIVENDVVAIQQLV